MSRKAKGIAPGDVPSGDPMDGRVIYPFQISDLEGRLLTFIEGLGLRESQEKAAKDLFRDIYYTIMWDRTHYVDGRCLNEAIVKSDALRSGAQVGGSARV
ncbi:hypothetical protein G8O24_33090 [Bradyrhizobium sp. INPA01-394B]|uniref:Uncharacterized protein n=1 Tax=Bradyrhizobium campsiandrae TaxID=1729892 RepID=A0ABR7UL68_9BRAD|nr:hypothetical protein [Bradyrhizobium campsiandrae]MBC9882165.1 hypothetical protein [Bradyrhizobium campsiandrae]MBC9984346.1 hypothetical protein [Bradyrhizobium campsiandrae]